MKKLSHLETKWDGQGHTEVDDRAGIWAQLANPGKEVTPSALPWYHLGLGGSPRQGLIANPESSKARVGAFYTCTSPMSPTFCTVYSRHLTYSDWMVEFTKRHREKQVTLISNCDGTWIACCYKKGWLHSLHWSHPQNWMSSLGAKCFVTAAKGRGQVRC